MKKLYFAATFVALLACGPAMAQIINPINYHDYVMVTNNKPLMGPDGMQTSCVDIAQWIGSDLALSNDSVLRDSVLNDKSRYSPSARLFGVPLVQWTPDTVSFLNNSIRQCAKESTLGRRVLNSLMGLNNISTEMSPQMASDVVNQIYATITTMNKQDAEQRAQIAEANQRAAEQEETQRQAMSQHIADLKSGKDRIGDMDDAIEFYSPQDLDLIISSPLLIADNGYYAGIVTLDTQQRNGVLLAKINNYVDQASSPPRFLPVAYVFLKYKNAIIFDPSLLRLEHRVRVVGRYVKNAKYNTVLGETKTSPVLDVLYIGH